MNDLSVIIRVRNEERYIGHTIQSVLEYCSNSEIIVIDNNSTDSSIKIVDHFKRDPSLDGDSTHGYGNIINLNINDYSPGRALNLGVQNATKKYIMIISAHCVIKLLNLNEIINYLEKNIAIFGKQIPIWNGKKIKPKYIWSNFKDEEIENPYSEEENRYFFHNAFSFFKKEVLLKFKFNENLVGKEDRYWANDRISKGEKILYTNTAIVEHHFTENGNTWKNV